MSQVMTLHRGRADRLGVALSVACIVHCLASPLLAVAATAAGLQLVAEERVHLVLALLVVVVGGLAFWPGYRRHHRLRVPAGAGLGTALLWAPSLVGEALGAVGEPLVVVVGGLLLVRAHLQNRSLDAERAGCTLSTRL